MDNKPIEASFIFALAIAIVTYFNHDAIMAALPQIIISIIIIGSIVGSIILVIWYLINKPEKTIKSTNQSPDDFDIRRINDTNDIFKEDDEILEPKVQSTPALQETIEQEVPKQEFVLNTDKLLKTPLHAELGLYPEEIEYLKKWKYQRKEFVPLGEIRRQPFWIKECKPESLEHTFVVQSIAKKLPEWANVRTYFTQLPDVVFTYNGKEYALEIETPLFIKKKHKRLVAKANVNNQTYGNRWWIVTTRSAYKNSFKRYGKVLTRSQIDEWIQSIFPE